MHFLGQEDAVGAEVNVLAAFENAGCEFADAGIDQRLAAANADDRRAGLVDRGQALLDRELVLDRLLVLANAPAAGAGEIAGVQRLEHEHERIALLPRDFLLGDIAGHVERQTQGKTHYGDSVRNSRIAACQRKSERVR